MCALTLESKKAVALLLSKMRPFAIKGRKTESYSLFIVSWVASFDKCDYIQCGIDGNVYFYKCI